MRSSSEFKAHGVPLRIANPELHRRICDRFERVGLRPYDFAATVTSLEGTDDLNLTLWYGVDMRECRETVLPVHDVESESQMVESFLDEVIPLVKQSVMDDYRAGMAGSRYV